MVPTHREKLIFKSTLSAWSQLHWPHLVLKSHHCLPLPLLPPPLPPHVWTLILGGKSGAEYSIKKKQKTQIEKSAINIIKKLGLDWKVIFFETLNFKIVSFHFGCNSFFCPLYWISKIGSQKNFESKSRSMCCQKVYCLPKTNSLPWHVKRVIDKGGSRPGFDAKPERMAKKVALKDRVGGCQRQGRGIDGPLPQSR